MNSVTFLMVAVVFAGSLLLTLGMRTFARQNGLLAHPNERSSHVNATPHGGGLVIMIAFFSAMIYLLARGEIEHDLFWALFCVVPIVIAGQIDDISPVPARYRMLVQAVCAIGGLYMLGGIDVLVVGNVTLNGWWLNAAALFYVIWMTNLYNFIDGIDGYAASEAVYVGVASFLLFGNMPGIFIAAAAAGFLIFNWHKASIFMGDVGSAPLGFIFAILSLSDAERGGFAGWMVLLSLFWFDATLTLWRRFRRGERLSSAHKKHVYQRLVQSGWAHDRVVRNAMGVNLLLFVLLWLSPESAYGAVLIVDIIVLYVLVRYVDRKKAFS